MCNIFAHSLRKIAIMYILISNNLVNIVCKATAVDGTIRITSMLWNHIQCEKIHGWQMSSVDVVIDFTV